MSTKSMLTKVILLAVVVVLGVGCGSEKAPTSPGPGAADVEDYLMALPSWAEFSPERSPGHLLVSGPVDSTQSYNGTGYDCLMSYHSLTESPDEITVFNPESQIMWLGSLLQGQSYVEGLESLAELPIRQRAPLNIFLDLLAGDVSRTVENPDPSSMATALGELVQQASDSGLVADSSVVFDQVITHSLEQAALDLGLSVNYLGPGVRSSLAYASSVEDNTVTAIFVQEMFSASVVLPQTAATFFSDQFTEERLNEQIDLGRIGPSNLPTYISHIVYGRILMLTMTSTSSIEEMMAALEATWASIDSGSIDAAHLSVLDASEIRVAAVGGGNDGLAELITTGQLGQYFAASAPLTAARPLSYTVRNLADNSLARVSETVGYTVNSCTPEYQEPTGAEYALTVDKLRVITEGCDGSFSPAPEVYYTFSVTTDSATTLVASLAAEDFVVVPEGGELEINSAPVNSDLYLNGRGTLRLTGTAWDYDVGTADEVMGEWDLSWNFGIFDGQRFYTRTVGGCTIRLYVSIHKVQDLYD